MERDRDQTVRWVSLACGAWAAKTIAFEIAKGGGTDVLFGDCLDG